MDIRRLEDINIDELPFKEDYYNKFFNGNISEAQKIINNNPQLKNKVINAENLNKLIMHILKLEDEYFNNTTDKLNSLIPIFQLKIDNLLYMNNYNKDLMYSVNNFVLYNNEIYYCIKNTPKNTLPTNKTYWLYLGLRGENSYKNLHISYKGIYGNNIQYKKFDMITYNNKLYVAKKDLRGQNPLLTEFWSLVMEVKNQEIYISSVKPKEAQIGSIWIELKEIFT